MKQSTEFFESDNGPNLVNQIDEWIDDQNKELTGFEIQAIIYHPYNLNENTVGVMYSAMILFKHEGL